MINKIGVFVGSSGLQLEGAPCEVDLTTPWGEASATPCLLETEHHQLVIMPRHGGKHEFAPHLINYRANIWLMQQLGVSEIVGTYTVGGINPAMDVGALVLADQLIDYTWGRAHTFDDEIRHIEFSEPFNGRLNTALSDAAHRASVDLLTGANYGCTQGPRLETAAEIVRMQRDGCDLVGMTLMPEASLARELDIGFAALCLIVNPAAGLAGAEIDMQAMRAIGREGAAKISKILLAFANQA